MAQSKGSLSDWLVLDKLITGPIVNLMYWAGLGIIVLIAFGIVGASVGLAIRGGPMDWLISLPTLAFGLLGVVILVALWRGFCEFYLVVFRISEDLRAIRIQNEGAARTNQGYQPPQQAAPPVSRYFPPNP